MGPFKVFLVGTQTGNWDAYKGVQAEFLPLIWTSERTTYSKYLPIAVLMMRHLPGDVENGFQTDGLHTAKLSEGSCNAVWMDYTPEGTKNKALKGTGGIIGLTLKGNALTRYFLVKPVTAKYSETFKKEVCQNETQKKDYTTPF